MVLDLYFKAESFFTLVFLSRIFNEVKSPANIIIELSDTVDQLQFEFFVGRNRNIFGGITKSDCLVHVFTKSALLNH